MHLAVVGVARQREVFLHLVQLVVIDDVERVFLAVDEALRQGQRQFVEADLADLRAESRKFWIANIVAIISLCISVAALAVSIGLRSP